MVATITGSETDMRYAANRVWSAGSVASEAGWLRPVVLTGLALQALGLGWLAHVCTSTVSYGALVPAFVINGVGMAMFMAPVATLVLGFVRRDEEGIASGAANALRELGGVFGVSVLASVFASHGSYLSPAAFAEGMRAAIAVGAVAVAIATLALIGVPRRRSLTVELHAHTADASEFAAAAA